MIMEKRGTFTIPRLESSERLKPISEADEILFCKRLEQMPKKDWRKFVENAEKHPELISCWDMSISFDEFARRVRAGEYD